MKVIRKTVFAAACLSLFSFACAEPPTSAGNVIRFEDQYWDIAYDADANITVYLGFDVVYFCSTYDLFGTEIPWMQVWKSDGTRYRNHFSGQVVAAVYAGPPDCAFILGSTPLATGVVHVRWNDNDVEPWLNPDRNNMNS